MMVHLDNTPSTYTAVVSANGFEGVALATELLEPIFPIRLVVALLLVTR